MLSGRFWGHITGQIFKVKKFGPLQNIKEEAGPHTADDPDENPVSPPPQDLMPLQNVSDND